MAAFKQNLVIEQGATFDKSYLWKVGKPLAPVDMTGYSARMQIRPTPGDVSVILSLTTEAGSLILGSNGIVRILIDAATTAGLSFVTASYDLEIVYGSLVRRLMQGTVKLSPNVTR